MIIIAEKLGFIRARAVAVCVKAGIGRRWGTRSPVFLPISNKTAPKTKILDRPR
jgi:hypothetical protein